MSSFKNKEPDSFSFASKLLNGTFDHFSKLWMSMKSELKAKEGDEAQYFKFRPRLTKLEDIMDEDISPLSQLDSDGSLISESNKVEQEFIEMVSSIFS